MIFPRVKLLDIDAEGSGYWCGWRLEAGGWKYGVARDQRIWCPERLKSTGTEVKVGEDTVVCVYS